SVCLTRPLASVKSTGVSELRFGAARSKVADRDCPTDWSGPFAGGFEPLSFLRDLTLGDCIGDGTYSSHGKSPRMARVADQCHAGKQRRGRNQRLRLPIPGVRAD